MCQFSSIASQEQLWSPYGNNCSLFTTRGLPETIQGFAPEPVSNMASHDHDRASRPSHLEEYSPSTSGHATPHTSGAPASYLHSSVSGLVSGFGGLVRRFSDMTAVQQAAQQKEGLASPHFTSPLGWPTYFNNGINGVYTPPIHRSVSPMRPPPLEPLQLKGFRDDTKESARLLTPAVAEEIRIMVPERQRIDDEWNLVYSLDQDGASLGTLYKACGPYVGERASFVLVVRDTEGGVSTYHPADPYQPSGGRTLSSEIDRFTDMLTLTAIRRLSIRSATPTRSLLWQRRVFPMAGLDHHLPCRLAPSTSFRRYDTSWRSSRDDDSKPSAGNISDGKTVIASTST